MSQALTPALVDVAELRVQIKLKYREVAETPEKGFHFHTGRPLAAMLDYPSAMVDPLPDAVVESFAGVNNPFCMGALQPGETVIDVGSGAGFDSILAARMVGPSGKVIGVDMTAEMRAKAAANARLVGLDNVEFVDGLAEALPLPDASADVAISNGVINLCPDKLAVYGLGTALVYPTLLAAVADAAHPTWRATALGVYRFWRDGGFAVGALVGGLLADAIGIPGAILTVAGATLASGLVVGALYQESVIGRAPSLASRRSASHIMSGGAS